ncbi:hypothetical protein HY58_18505 [Flavihumibacter sp. ZG627]|nr:hypothetical protein HY58_18505 [Flavihumibacter sp. ZG627]
MLFSFISFGFRLIVCFELYYYTLPETGFQMRFVNDINYGVSDVNVGVNCKMEGVKKGVFLDGQHKTRRKKAPENEANGLPKTRLG